MQETSAHEIAPVEARDFFKEEWLQLRGAIPAWAAWPQDVEQPFEIDGDGKKISRKITRTLTAAVVRVVRAHEVERRKIDPSGKVTDVHTFVKVKPGTYAEVRIPAGSVATFRAGLSKSNQHAYFVSNVIISRQDMCTPILGELSVYPGKRCVRVKVTAYASDGNYKVSEDGKRVIKRA